MRPATVPALRILSDASLRHPALVGYLASRGIVPPVAAAFCREVRYEINGRAFFAVGFRNDAGGWELRSERFKGGSSPKHITTIGNRSDTVIAFEGFMDFLSAATLGIVGNGDSLVLNSVSNVEKAMKHLDAYGRINCFLDRDEAGRRTLDVLGKRYGRRACDRSALYDGCKDLNEYLQLTTKKEMNNNLKIKLK